MLSKDQTHKKKKKKIIKKSISFKELHEVVKSHKKNCRKTVNYIKEFVGGEKITLKNLEKKGKKIFVKGFQKKKKINKVQIYTHHSCLLLPYQVH